MFFSDKEIEIAEDYAWESLDACCHQYCPNLDRYAHFYFKNKLILDPWVNEKSQECMLADHKNKDCRVDPVEYYGANTIDNYLAQLYLLHPNGHSKIKARIRKHLSNGILMQTVCDMPIVVHVAMSQEQADDEHCAVCIENPLPESDRIYFLLDTLPEEYVRIIKSGWEKEVVFKRADAKKVMNILYPNGSKGKYEKLLYRCKGPWIRLIGFGD